MGSHGETDPCSLDYKRHSHLRPSSLVASTGSKTRKSFPVAIRKARMGFFRCFKKIFKSKRKSRTSFVMPYEVSKPPAIPGSPRCSVNQIRASVMSTPVPAVCLTRPSVRRRRTSYRVHSYIGSGSPPSPRCRSLRFSHPVVSNFIVRTAHLSGASSNGTMDEHEEHAPRNASAATDCSDQSAELTIDGERKLRPETIFSFTSESVMTWNAFKERLDGHGSRIASNRVSERAPSLQCITRLPTIKLDEDIFQSPKHETVEKHRSDALKSLEGSSVLPSNDRYVLAMIPQDDLPVTAIKVHSAQYTTSNIPGGQLAMLPRPHLPDTALPLPPNQHPISLIPGGQSKPQRPETDSSASTFKGKGKYRAYSGVSQARIIRPQKPVEIELPRTPNMSREQFHKRHSEHYKRVESGQFARLAPIRQSRMSKQEFNKRHSAHYKRIESCIFNEEETLSGIDLPPALPSSLQKDHNSTFLLPPTPTSHALTPQQFSAYNPKPNPQTALTTASLPLHTPQPHRLAPIPILKTSRMPSPVPMNSDRYPFVFKHSGKRFSAEPKYQRRTVDYVEAKFRDAEMKVQARENKAKERDAKKMRKEREVERMRKEKEDERMREDLRILDDGVRRLMLF